MMVFLVGTAAADELGPEAATRRATRVPSAERKDTSEIHFGTTVRDPYRWLENAKDPKTEEWLRAEAELTRKQLSSLRGRDALRARMKQLLYSQHTDVPRVGGARLFFERTDANAEKAVIYVRGAGGHERKLLDPIDLAKDGTISVGHWKPSPDGRRLLYTRNLNNADEASLWIRDAGSAQDLPEHIDGVTYGLFAWDADGNGFYYVQFPTDGDVHTRIGRAEVRHHTIGSDVKSDRVERAGSGSAQKFPSVWTSHDGHWLFYGVDRDAHEDDIWARDLRKPGGGSFIPLVVGRPAWSGVDELGDRFYIQTNDRAPHGRVLVMDTANPRYANAKEIVPEDSGALLEEMSLVGGKLVLRRLRNAVSELEVRELDGGKPRKLALPPLGTVATVEGLPDKGALYFDFVSFTLPSRVYRVSVNSGELELWSEDKVPADTAPYVAEQVWYPSKDGTKISMFLVHRKDAARDGTTPFLIDGYGGFDVNQTPYFTVGTWMESGGALALPNLRGGGEYGESWHKAGMLEHKQNVFDDFIAAAEYLIAQKWTRKDKLAIEGGSNGGLLMGAVLTQRPDLFGAVVIEAPLLDMLRYPAFGMASMWTPEFGSPDDESSFRVLGAYSPYHHVRAAAYPPVLFLSSADDDRVDPAHARKMAAALQAANTAPTPILFRALPHAGHEGADQRAATLEESLDRGLFLYHQLKLPARAGAPWLPVLEKTAAPR
jgi:prolyl oligopeptidase